MTLQETLVCIKCIDDEGICDFIEGNEVQGDCSFCDGGSTITAPLDDVIDHMKTSLEYEYDDVLNWFYYDYEEGDYVGEYWDTWDLLREVIGLDLPNDYNGILFQEILDRLPDRSWCQADPFGVPDQDRVRYDWEWFSEVVMHRRRFFFEDHKREPGTRSLSPGEFLASP